LLLPLPQNPVGTQAPVICDADEIWDLRALLRSLVACGRVKLAHELHLTGALVLGSLLLGKLAARDGALSRSELSHVFSVSLSLGFLGVEAASHQLCGGASRGGLGLEALEAGGNETKSQGKASQNGEHEEGTTKSHLSLLIWKLGKDD